MHEQDSLNCLSAEERLGGNVVPGCNAKHVKELDLLNDGQACADCRSVVM